MSADHSIRAVTYYRKSNEDDGGSVEQQQKWALAAAPQQGIEILREFTDQAKKGHETATRTAFHDMLRFCQQEGKQGRPVEAIVCWHPNRFSRADSIETGWFVHEFRKAGVCRMFTAARGWVDFGRMEDRIIFGIEQDASNHRYVVDLAQDATRGRLAGAREGRWMGGPIPYGYRPEMEKVTVKGKTRWRTARLVLGPDAEADVVRRIFLDYANTAVGLRQLAQRLTADGVPTPRGGKSWTVHTVRNILTHPVYLGRLVWGRRVQGKFFGVVDAELVPLTGPRKSRPNGKAVRAPSQTHEPLVDVAVWERCQAKLARRKKERQPRLGCYALSGLVRCGHCGANMVARVVEAKGHSYRRVFCGTYNRCGSPACEYNAVDADALARAVVEKLQERLFSEGALEALRREISGQADGAVATGKALAALEARLAVLERKVDQAGRRVVDEDDEALVPTLRKHLKAVTAERDELARQVEAARRSRQPAGDLEEVIREAMALAGRFQEALTAEDGDLLREVLGEAVSYVELFFDHSPAPGGKVHSDYARGLIYLRPQRWNESTSGCSVPGSRRTTAALPRAAPGRPGCARPRRS
jgi:DNA invertase Pin-like site-specific DNA recombinase